MTKAISSRYVIYAAFSANLLIAISKFIAAFATGSSSILSEAIHSVVDTVDQVLLLIGERRGKRPADAEHPFGHGLEQYFWGFVVAILIFALGGGMSIFEGIRHIRHPEPIRNPFWNYAVLAVAFAAEGFSFSAAYRSIRRGKGSKGVWGAFRASKNPSIFVAFAEDSAALTGLLLALAAVVAGQTTGSPVWDGIGSILIGLLLVLVAVVLAYETRGLLTGESARPEVVRRVREIALAEPGVLGTELPLTMHFGSEQVLLNMEVRFRPEASVADVAKAQAAIRSRVREAFPSIRLVFISVSAGPHADPGPPESQGS